MRDRNTIFALNNIIYNIYNTEDFEKMKRRLLISLKSMIPNCCATIFEADTKDNDMLVNPMCEPHSYIQMERRYPNVKSKDFSDWVIQRKQPIVIRVSDIMSDEERVKTDYYKLAFEPYRIHHTVYVTIASHNLLLGMLALYRHPEEEDFSSEDVFLLQLLSEHLNVRFYKETKSSNTEAYYIGGYNFTMRELQIVKGLLNGSQNEELCKELSISQNTLKKHLQHIYRKTGVSGKRALLNHFCKE